MALDTERTPAASGVAHVLKRLAGPLAGLANGARFLLEWLGRTPLFRFLSLSLLRRILATNLVGLSIMIGGIHYLSQYHGWLIDAKRESLKVQGEMIAAAIASDARVEQGSLQIDADKLTDATNGKASLADDSFRDLELSIRPERVAPLLRRLNKPTKTRARIYDRDGTLIVDSARLLKRGQLNAEENTADANKRLKTKNFWTRLKAWLIDEDLPVYKEIGNGNGLSYPEVRMALGGTPTPMLLLNDDGEQIVSMAVPIKRLTTTHGVLLLSTRPGEIDEILDEERGLIWTLAAVALLASIVTSLMLARTVAGPMRRLSEAAEDVSRNRATPNDLPDYSERKDEVGQMAAAFKAMTAALYRRIEASERFAADVAHELKNPLAAARSTAESLAFAKSDSQRSELVSQIQNELKRLNRLITDVSAASRLDAELARQQMRPIDTTHVVMTVAQIFRDIAADENKKVRTNIEPAPFDGAFQVNGHEGRLGQVLTNLVDNAISFSPPGSTVTIHVAREGPSVELMVEDQGPGIPEDRLSAIFERFYTDRPATEKSRGKNSGLGLSISRDIVLAHGGDIWAENIGAHAGANTSQAQGAKFVVRLPALHPAPRSSMTSGRRA